MTMDRYHLKIIVLAAGKSSRFNGIKVLAPVIKTSSKNTPQNLAKEHSISMIEHVLNEINLALSTLTIKPSNLQIATGKYHTEIAKLIGEKHSLIYCQDAHLGMGHTIANAVGSVLQQANNAQDEANNISHVMITLADQIALNTDDYIKLIKQSMKMPAQLICAISSQVAEQVASNGSIKTFVNPPTNSSVNTIAKNKTKNIGPPAIFPYQYFCDLIKLQGDKGAKALLHANEDNLETILLPNAKIDIDTPAELNNWINA